ncbi:type II restriction/modification system DNA methylase subunit YeeA [Arthrobacter sp. UYCu511]|uniref:DNA methyltransferase n=1 Tax=Arthrobacter sp. UYCu511 TaxID=3156337 RepID=UPI00339722A1
MPSFDSIVVGEDWISEHYFTTDSTKESFQSEVLKLRKQWDEITKSGLDSTLKKFLQARGSLQVDLAGLLEQPDNSSAIYQHVREALGYQGTTAALATERAGTELVVPNVWASANGGLLFVEASPVDSVEDLLDSAKASMFGSALVDGKETDYAAPKLVSELYQTDAPPEFIVVMGGRFLILTERVRWAEGRYLAADLLLACERNDAKRGGELDRILAIFGRESLLPDASESIWWNQVLESSVKHTVGVSKDLREGIRSSIEIIANDVLHRRADKGLPLDEIDGQVLARQSLRYLYRILFLLYAEASPEMGVLPTGAGEYAEGYGLDRLRELALTPPESLRAQSGTHIYQSLNTLFRLVDQGHHPSPVVEPVKTQTASTAPGLHFNSLTADLFDPQRMLDIDHVSLGNAALQKVLERLLLSKESKGKDRGFISYAELGVNQLGAVYEGLMSYTGFIAETDLYEVAKDGDSAKGSWVVPVERAEGIDRKDFVMIKDELTGEEVPVLHGKGSFVYRLAGRERQQSASYYTPEVLTKFVVSQALEELLDQNGEKTPADDILKLTVCEPALGSGAFAIEAVRQLAAEYLKRKQDELDTLIPAEDYPVELQKVKAHIALHQVYGVDLNSTAVELAEVSLWLDTMVSGLKAPWFGLHLRRGNSLIGARRATYSRAAVSDKSWLTTPPADAPLQGLADAMAQEGEDHTTVGRIHHFLLPAAGWGAAAEAKEVKDLAGEAQKELKAWRNKIKSKPSKSQVDRLISLGHRVETLWQFVLRRLDVAESEVQRSINYFGKMSSGGSVDTLIVTRAEIEEKLADPNGAYQRLRLVMDAWNALWFWPLTEKSTNGATPPTIDEWLAGLEGILGTPTPESNSRKYGFNAQQGNLFKTSTWGELNTAEENELILAGAIKVDKVIDSAPWLRVCQGVASDQGFFHWELDFASVFGRGGFDLQVGNPPWVRPRSDEASLLAEADPWWQLVAKPPQSEIKSKRAEALAQAGMHDFFIDNAIPTTVLSHYLGAETENPVLAGLQPDLYRAFMVRTWRSTSPFGVIGLLHPESHFTEKKAAVLRAETYRRLRRHWQFINELSLFEIHHLVSYGVHIYGARSASPSFVMAASLYHPDTVARSLVHNGSGDVPGLKDPEGNWDQRPHKERIIHVNPTVLAVWADILDEPGTPSIQARMVYPVNVDSSKVLEKLSRAPRVRELGLQYSRGWDESIDRKKGYFEVGSKVNDSWDDVILQGPHFTVATPFAKEPNPTMKNNLDWSELDLEALPADFIPRTSYQPAGDRSDYDSSYTHWLFDDQLIPAKAVHRLGWRLMAATTGVRTFYPTVILPGTTHVNGVISGFGPSISQGRLILELAGFLSALPIDFLAKAGSLGHFYGSVVNTLPARLQHGLSGEIQIRAAALICLTADYSSLWCDVQATQWTTDSPLRIAAARRLAQVELDAIVSIVLGIDADELCTIYRTQFPVLHGYERANLYDTNGRKVPGEMNKLYRQHGETLSEEQRTWTHPQSGVTYVFEFPFVGYDREADMRTAHAHFTKLMEEMD